MKKLFLFIALLLGAVTAMAEGPKAETATFTVAPGEIAKLPLNYVRTDITLSARITFKKFQPVKVGLGPDIYRGGWVEITQNEVIAYDINFSYSTDENGKKVRTRQAKETGRFEHGLKMKSVKQIDLCIESGHGSAQITLETKKGKVKQEIKKWWEGGEPFVENLGNDTINAELSFTRNNSVKPIWFYADSYFSSISSSRWPYYMKKAGKSEWMADHIPGGHTPQLLECFKHDLEFGKPEIAVWMLGMNDGSDKDSPSSVWLEGVTEFIAICKEKGITPVITTIPTVPKRFHDKKTEWVRDSGVRYIDWYKATGTDSKGTWKEGFLHKDNVHPSPKGAEALWKAVEKALPELQ